MKYIAAALAMGNFVKEKPLEICMRGVALGDG